jgi:hypothetical protein
MPGAKGHLNESSGKAGKLTMAPGLRHRLEREAAAGRRHERERESHRRSDAERQQRLSLPHIAPPGFLHPDHGGIAGLGGHHARGL